MSPAVHSLLQACWSSLVRRAAGRYVAGPGPADALRACRRLAQHGFGSTVGYWNRHGESPRQLADAHLAVLDLIAREGLDCSVSVKAPPLRFARDLLREVVERAQQGGLGVHFDSLAPETADETFSLIAEELRHYPKLGCTLPGRWRRSLRDADLAVDLKVNVRVVKGQWGDALAPDLDMRTGFLAVIDRLAGRAAHVGVATHDAALAREALRRLRRANTPCELELLWGLPTHPVLREAAAAGVPARFYVAYGHAVLPYRLSHALGNPRIIWWMFRDLVQDGGLLPPVPESAAVGLPRG